MQFHISKNIYGAIQFAIQTQRLIGTERSITFSKLTIKTPEQGVKYVHIRSGVFIVAFEHISHLVLFFIVNFEQVNADS